MKSRSPLGQHLKIPSSSGGQMHIKKKMSTKSDNKNSEIQSPGKFLWVNHVSTFLEK